MNQTFNREDLVNIIRVAWKQQDQDEREEALNHLNQITGGSIDNSVSGTSGISIDDIFSVADELKIKPQYVKKTIELMHPSPEQQLKDLDNIEAKPSLEVRTVRHHKLILEYISELSSALSEAIPFKIEYDTEKVNDYDYYRYGINITFYMIKINERKNIFGKIKREEVRTKFASFNFKYVSADFNPLQVGDLRVELYHPYFLSAVNNIFTSLNQRYEKILFNNIFPIIYDYEPNKQ